MWLWPFILYRIMLRGLRSKYNEIVSHSLEYLCHSEPANRQVRSSEMSLRPSGLDDIWSIDYIIQSIKIKSIKGPRIGETTILTFRIHVFIVRCSSMLYFQGDVRFEGLFPNAKYILWLMHLISTGRWNVRQADDTKQMRTLWSCI